MPAPDELVEVSASELANLRRSKDLLNGLYTSKDHGAQTRRALKKLDPTLQIPEDVADEYAEPLRRELADTKKQLDALKAQQDEDRTKRKDEDDLAELNRRIDSVVAKRGLTEDGRAGLIDMMQKRQLADPEAAALLYLDSLPKPQPRKAASILPQDFNLMQVNDGKDKTDESTQRFWDNPMRAMELEAINVINEMEAA